MRSHRRWLALGATLALIVSCSSSKSKTEGSTGAHETEENDTRDDGDETPPPPAGAKPRKDASAVMALAVWPERWTTVDAAFASLAAKAEPVKESLEEAELTSAWSIAALLFRAVGWTDMVAPPAGLDGGAPLVFELLPAPAQFEEVALAQLRAKPGAALDVAMWPRFRVTLPARDADAVATAIIERAGASLAEVDAGRVYASDTLLVRIARVPGAVVLDLASGPGIADLDDARREALLGAEPSASSVPAFAQDRASALRMIVRVDGVGDLGAISGMLKTVGALRGASSAMQNLFLLEGTSETMVAYLLMDPTTSVADAALVDIPADAGQPMQLVLALSDPGRAVFDAAGLGDGKRATVAELDWDAAIAEAPITPILEAVEHPADLAELFHECGWSCWQYVLLGNAVQLARSLGGADALDAVVGPLLAETPAMATALRGAALTREGRFVIVGGSDTGGLELPAGADPAPGAAKAATCYRKALVAVREAFGAVARVDPSQKRVALQEGVVALDGAASCAKSDPAIAARYATTKALVDEVVTKAGLHDTP